MSMIPAHLMRSMAGGYDNESIAVTAICLTFYLYPASVSCAPLPLGDPYRKDRYPRPPGPPSAACSLPRTASHFLDRCAVPIPMCIWWAGEVCVGDRGGTSSSSPAGCCHPSPHRRRYCDVVCRLGSQHGPRVSQNLWLRPPPFPQP